MLATPYDHIAEQYDAVRTILRSDEARYLSLVLERLEPGSTILDLGCGTGRPIATQIASRGHRVVGVDGSEAMLTLARGRLPGHRWIHDLMQCVELDETFDGVICWDALFHLHRSQFDPMIRKIHRWLKPGGRMMVSSGGVVEGDGNGFASTMFGHEFRYDSLPPGQLVKAIENTGFEILVAEMCEEPDGADNRGKWATVASRRAEP